MCRFLLLGTSRLYEAMGMRNEKQPGIAVGLFCIYKVSNSILIKNGSLERRTVRCGEAIQAQDVILDLVHVFFEN